MRSDRRNTFVPPVEVGLAGDMGRAPCAPRRPRHGGGDEGGDRRYKVECHWYAMHACLFVMQVNILFYVITCGASAT